MPKPNCSAKTVSDEEIGDPDWQVASGAFRTFRHELWHEASLSILRKLSRHGGWSDGGDSSSLRAEQMAAESSLAGVECSHLEVSVWDLLVADVRRTSIFRDAARACYHSHFPPIRTTVARGIHLLFILRRSTVTGLVHSLDAEQLRLSMSWKQPQGWDQRGIKRAHPLKRGTDLDPSGGSWPEVDGR